MGQNNIPSNITNNAATIYEASLMYERMGKCGTVILGPGQEWTQSSNIHDNRIVSRIHIISVGEPLVGGTAIFTTLTNVDMLDIDGNSASIPVSTTYYHDMTIYGGFSTITTAEIEGLVVVLYMDCPQS
tara:strand:+ start:582 stop:968 length:387 start_codon:yes stop_codon:yes gene_type:complete